MIYALVIASVMVAPAPTEANSSDLDAYKEAKANAGHDADSHVRLALWCEAHRLAPERTKHLTIATLIDPKHPTARGLLGMVQYEGKWLSPDAVAQRLQNDPEQQAKVKEYLERRVKAGDNADDQMKLALWCEQAGLVDQATAHFYRTAQLNPGRDRAWKHLGYEKEKGRWVKPGQLAAEQEMVELQVKANKHWKPILDKLRDGLASKKAEERAEAQAALDEIKDPAAVPAIWVVFAQRDARHQEVAVRLLGQIDAPGASRALAYIAVASPSKDIRRQSVEVLRRRDPRDFAAILIAFLCKPIEYEIRRQPGVNTPGELFVKGNSQNISRFYTHLPPPSIILQVGDSLVEGPGGLPVIARYLGSNNQMSSTRIDLTGQDRQAVEQRVLAERASQVAAFNSTRTMPSHLQSAGLDPATKETLSQLFAVSSVPYSITRSPDSGNRFLNVSDTLHRNSFMDIPIGQMQLDTQRSVQVSQQQLARDVRQLEAYNESLRATNRVARQLLADSTGVDLGDDPEVWQPWLTNLMGYAPSESRYPVEVPTFSEEVTSDYQPQAVVSFREQVVGFSTSIQATTTSCFASGTPVKTINGRQMIETLKAGDLVMTQNITTGRISFSPVLIAYHNPPSETLRLHFEGQDADVVATGIHRFWKVGQGWAMARDLKPGDTLRAIGGTATVASIEADTKQPVFNLRVADGESFFVGEQGILAHDNSLVDPVDKPFDRVVTQNTSVERN